MTVTFSSTYGIIPVNTFSLSYNHKNQTSGRLPPLQTYINHFCEMKYLLKKETHNKNEDNTLKEQNEIFLTVYGLPK